MLPVSSEVILRELDLAGEIVSKWKEAFSTTGVPGIDMPSTPEATENFLREFCGELMLLAGKCETLATVLGEGQ